MKRLVAAVAVLVVVVVGGQSEAGIVGAWNFDEGSGTVASDSSGNHYDGSIVGSTVTWVGGETGSALHFDGTHGSYVTIPNTSGLNFPSGFTLKASIRMNPGEEIDEDRAIVGKHIGTEGTGYFLSVRNAHIGFFLNNNITTGNPTRLFTDIPYNDGKWHEVWAVWDGAYEYLYVDSQLKTKQWTTYDSFSSADIRMGELASLNPQSVAYRGALDNVRLEDSPQHPVPEHSTLVVFLGLGGVGLVAAWRRRKRAA